MEERRATGTAPAPRPPASGLHQGEDGGCGLVLSDGDDVVHILLAELVSQLTGGLDLNAVCEGRDGGKGLVFVLMEERYMLGAPSACTP
mgnify:CR=1 FL=1